MRSGLSYVLRKLFNEASQQTVNTGRRDFIKKSAMATIALSLPLSGCFSSKKPSVVIVGGGIAGLCASYQLKKMNIPHTLFEASGRLGGRIFTVQDAVVDNAYLDLGAEFIDTIHEDILKLSKKFNVELLNLHEDELESKTYFFEGKYYTEKDIVEALQPFANRLAADVARLPEGIHYNKANDFSDLDNQSVTSYLKSIGINGWLLKFFETAMEGEYAMNANEQSAMNLLVMLSVPIAYSSEYHLLGNYHEVYKFKGGSQKFIDALVKRAGDNAKMGYKLQKLHKKEDAYSLTFETAQGNEIVEADYVVLAFPFTVLRDVQRNFKFTERKEQWIAEAGFGNAIKVSMGFNKRTWREAGYQGYTFTDVSDAPFWDSTQMIETGAGSLTFAGGGTTANELSAQTNEEIEKKMLNAVGKVYPGAVDEYNKRIVKYHWSLNPLSKGSYTSYKAGQWSKFAGVEAEPFENIFFAGEHCSVNHQGFMNGAAETGRKAAEEISKLLSESA